MDLYEQIKAGLVRVHHLSPGEIRFWYYTNKDGPEHPTLGKCWVWEGRREEYGYGAIGANGRHYKAHRYSWEIHNGPIPGRLCVLHRCDNPPCVNPAHLFLGTRVDNNLDRMAKDRGGDRKGRKNGRAKLTDEQVAEILRRYKPGCAANGGAALAREFGVVSSTIGWIVRGQHWRHVVCA